MQRNRAMSCDDCILSRVSWAMTRPSVQLHVWVHDCKWSAAGLLDADACLCLSLSNLSHNDFHLARPDTGGMMKLFLSMTGEKCVNCPILVVRYTPDGDMVVIVGRMSGPDLTSKLIILSSSPQHLGPGVFPNALQSDGYHGPSQPLK